MKQETRIVKTATAYTTEFNYEAQYFQTWFGWRSLGVYRTLRTAQAAIDEHLRDKSPVEIIKYP